MRPHADRSATTGDAREVSPEADFERWRARGDMAAIGRVFDRLAPDLLIVAAHVAGRGSAEDLVQMVFLEALDHGERWDAGRPLRPWLVGILVRLARRERARGARTRPALSSEGAEGELVPAAASEGPEAQAERAEAAGAIAEALARLPRHYRQVLSLRLAHGLEPTAIAHTLGAPLATVKSRLQRGLARLREVLPNGHALPALALLPTRSLTEVRAAVLARAEALLPAASVASALSTGTLWSLLAMSKLGLTLIGLTLAGLLGYGLQRLGAEGLGPSAAESPEDSGPVAPAVEAVDRATELDAAAPVADGPDGPERRAILGTTPAAVPAPPPPTLDGVRGIVVDEAGQPLADIAVLLGDRTIYSFVDFESFLRDASTGPVELLVQPPACHMTRTDARGEFVLPLPPEGRRYLLVAFSEMRGARGLEWPTEVLGPISITLPVDGVVSGVLRSTLDGAPIANGQVQLWPGRSGMPIAFTQCDDAGAFTLPRLPPGDYRVSADRRGFKEAESSLTLLPGEPRHSVDLRLEPLPAIRTLLVGADQRPWTEARREAIVGPLRPEGASWSASLCEHSPRRHGELEGFSWRVTHLELDEEGFLTGFDEDTRPRTLSVWRGTELVFEHAAFDPRAETIALEPLASGSIDLGVRVRFDPPSTGHTNLLVQLTDPSGFGRQSTPILAGRFQTTEFVLPVPRLFAGARCGLHVQSEGRVPYFTLLDVPAAASGMVHEVLLTLPTGDLEGQVVDAEGRSIPHPRLVLADLGGGWRLPVEETRRRGAADGTFALYDLPPGELRVLVSAPGFADRAFVLDTRGGEPKRLTLQAPRELSLQLPDEVRAGQVRVLDVDGLPLLDDVLSGTRRFGGTKLLLDATAVRVEVIDALHGRVVATGDVPAAGPLVLRQVK